MRNAPLYQNTAWQVRSRQWKTPTALDSNKGSRGLIRWNGDDDRRTNTGKQRKTPTAWVSKWGPKGDNLCRVLAGRPENRLAWRGVSGNDGRENVKLLFKRVQRVEKSAWDELQKELANLSATCKPSRSFGFLGLDIIRVAGLVVEYNTETEVMKRGDRRFPDPQEMKKRIIKVCKKYGFKKQDEE